ncbi:unnamed protein product [Bubo scandiacus]
MPSPRSINHLSMMAPSSSRSCPTYPPIRSRHMASYQVVVEEFMERRVVALAMGDGFEGGAGGLGCLHRRRIPRGGEHRVTHAGGHRQQNTAGSPSSRATSIPRPHKGRSWPLQGRLGTAAPSSPIILQLSPWTSLHQAHHLFELLKLQRVFVTRCGELVGAVSRLRRAIEELANPK